MLIGNSFFYDNNGLPGHVSLMQKAADPEHKQDYRAIMVTIGGSGFDWHDVEHYFRPNAIGYYAFDAQNNVVVSSRDRLVDAAVMMDCSQCPIQPAPSPGSPNSISMSPTSIIRVWPEPVWRPAWCLRH